MSGASLRFERGREGPRVGLSSVRCRQAHELSMQPQVAAELGVKTKRGDPAVAHGHRMPLVRRDHLDVAGPLDQRRPDEDPWKRLAVQAIDAKRRLEAVYLPPISVAADGDVEQA